MLIEYYKVETPSDYNLRRSWEVFFKSDYYASDKYFKTFELAQTRMKELLLFAVNDKLEARNNDGRILDYHYEINVIGSSDRMNVITIHADTEQTELKHNTIKSSVVVNGVQYDNYSQEAEKFIYKEEIRFSVSIVKISVDVEEEE